MVSPGCHFCADADDTLTEMAAQYPMTVRRVPLTSAEGTDLVQRHRAAMSPLVLFDGAFVSAGRLSRGRLRKALAAHATTTAGSGVGR